MYEGSLNINKMNPIQKKAYKSWKDQGQRCQNPNDKGFKYWGAKGIKRIYGPREFIAWYEKEYAKKDNWKRAHVDRIDSDGNYEFGNIQLIEISENTKKRNDLYGNPMPSTKIKCNYPDGSVKEFDSIREASRVTEISRKSIQTQIRGLCKRSPHSELRFFI